MNANERPELAGEGAVNVNDACRLLGIKRTYAYALMGSGELKYAKIGKRRVIMVAEIRRFLAEHLVGEIEVRS